MIEYKTVGEEPLCCSTAFVAVGVNDFRFSVFQLTEVSIKQMFFF